MAQAFKAALEITSEDAAALRSAILSAVAGVDATETDSDEFGRRFVSDINVSYHGRKADIRTAWIIRRGEDFLRLTSCYVS